MYARIPRQLIRLDRAAKCLSGKVMVLIRPARRVGDFIGESRRGKNLSHQRIGIKRDARHQLIERLGLEIRKKGRMAMLLLIIF